MSSLETLLSLDQSIDRFLADLLNANRSQHTVRNYRIALSQFADVTPVLMSEVTLHHVQAFLDTLSPSVLPRGPSNNRSSPVSLTGLYEAAFLIPIQCRPFNASGSMIPSHRR